MNKSKKSLPFGSWKSPISSELITTESVSLDQVRTYRGTIYWLERRPTESGRTVIVSSRQGVKQDVFPQGFNARSRVHEYGGGIYCVCDPGVFFVNDADQDIYLQANHENPDRITRTGRQTRYADLYFDHWHNRILCVCEDHRNDDAEPDNSLVEIDISSGAVTTLCQGYDFYSNPRLSPDGSKLAWLCWNHPNMPWDGTELWTADVDRSGKPAHPVCVSGGANTSIFQPEWSPDNFLYFVSDESGWWNLQRMEGNKAVPVTRMPSEFGLPQWVFGQTTYAFCGHNTLCCTHITEGRGELSLLDLNTLELRKLSIPYNAFMSLCADEHSVCFIAASDNSFPQLVKLSTGTLETETLASSCNTAIDPGYISAGQHLCFETRHGDKAYAIYYPPANKDCQAPENERPPLIVICHGGPTGSTDAALDLRKQYWTSRGFAMLDVNYSGSTGYGREYRERLNFNWGVRDVEDVCDAAMYFAAKGIADEQKLIIKGSSAGGYTVLAALAFHDVFACGASYYGISDLESLLADTHKFESRYTDRLVGPYPEHRQDYHDRSPINHVDRLSCPVIFFQGLEDKVVPPSQAEKMVAALKQKGIAVSYVPFPNEQHGFRQASTIKTALDAELYFYSMILGFEPADAIEKIAIANIDI
ncbi:MAG: S9 family peptidase [Thiotrichales bacterium]|nr:MAG: S9 family peptidase [Thiotrichales bacterium]